MKRLSNIKTVKEIDGKGNTEEEFRIPFFPILSDGMSHRGEFQGFDGKVACSLGQQSVTIIIDWLLTIASAYVPSGFGNL